MTARCSYSISQNQSVEASNSFTHHFQLLDHSFNSLALKSMVLKSQHLVADFLDFDP